MKIDDARLLAKRLMAQYGIGHWTLVFDNAKKRAGRCSYRIETINLSRPITTLNDEDFVRDTILHEIAHAIVGPGCGHGPKWRAMCRKVGAKPERCFDSKGMEMPKGKWQARCEPCDRTYNRHRALNAADRWRCGVCKREVVYMRTV